MEMTTVKKVKEPATFTSLFVDAAGVATTRVPMDVRGMTISEVATEKSYTYNLSDLPQNVMLSLAAAGMKKVMEAHIRNHAEQDGSNILELAADVFAKLAEGKVYARAAKGEKIPGTGKTGPKFDSGFYAAVAKSFKKRNTGQEASAAEVEGFVSKLSAMTPKERAKKITEYRKSPHFNAAYLAEQAAKANQKVGDTETELDIF